MERQPGVLKQGPEFQHHPLLHAHRQLLQSRHSQWEES